VSVALACLLLFASGAAALVFEALWFHQAAIALGSDAIAASCVLAAFMGGLALGGLLAARLVRGQGSALRRYALLELCVGLLGLVAVHALPRLGSALVPLGAQLESGSAGMLALRIGATLALLGIPATAMGATLPVLLAAVAPGSARFGRALGALYAANTLGAVSGVMMAELHFVPHYGVRASALVACFACIGIAITALILGRDAERAPSASPEPATSARAALSQAAPLLLSAGLCAASCCSRSRRCGCGFCRSR
jgi:spermidine synthase